MSLHIIENEYRKDILELNAEQALMINYDEPENLLQMVSGLGTIGEIPELFNDDKPFAINIAKDGFHMSETLLKSLVGTIEVPALICSISDEFFKNKDFEFMFKDLVLASFEHNIAFIRLLLIKKDGIVLKIDTAMNKKSEDDESEACRICNLLELEITKLLNDIPKANSTLEIENGEIIVTVENFDTEYDDNLYYLVNMKDLDNTRIIIIEN